MSSATAKRTRRRNHRRSPSSSSILRQDKHFHFFLALLLLLIGIAVLPTSISAVDVQPHNLRVGGHKAEKQQEKEQKKQLNATYENNVTDDIPTASIQVPLLAASGTHHLQVYAGQPPVPQTLIIDTGSRLTAWRCDTKDSYNPDTSSTVQRVKCGSCSFPSSTCDGSEKQQCTSKQRYTEGSSWEAFEVNDIISLSLATESDYEDSLDTSFPFTFGCQTAVTGLFRNQFAHGILGLERYNKNSLAVQLHKHGVTNSTAFSLCLNETGGSMGLGGAQRSKHVDEMALTPLVQNKKNTYPVMVEQVWLGDACLTENNPGVLNAFRAGKGTIIDSGTTDTYLPEKIHDVFEATWLEQTGRPVLGTQNSQTNSGSRSALYTYQELQTLPDVRFVLANNVTLTIPAVHYMEGAGDLMKAGAAGNKNKSVILHNRMYTNEAKGAVLGINAMLGYDILFDPENNQIGFATADC